MVVHFYASILILSRHHFFTHLTQNERDISAAVFANMQSMVTLTNLTIDDTESFTVRQ
jgi:hypothetical protein